MRISAKGRYAVAAMVHMAQEHGKGDPVTVISISEALGISKIYLEQVFSLLRRAGIVRSVKGAQGGYQLQANPEHVTVLDVLGAVELALFEPAQPTVVDKAPDIDGAMRDAAFEPADKALQKALGEITLSDLVGQAQQRRDEGAMYYI